VRTVPYYTVLLAKAVHSRYQRDQADQSGVNGECLHPKLHLYLLFMYYVFSLTSEPTIDHSFNDTSLRRHRLHVGRKDANKVDVNKRM
jgi:hypothetical protein